MPNNDIIPDSPENLYEWAKNFCEKAPVQLAGLAGWDANRINSLISRLGTIRDTGKSVVDAQAVVDEKLGDLEGAKNTHLASIRQDFSNIKVSGGYNIGIGEVLEILTDSATFNPLTYKPVITRITSFGGHNEIMTKKRGVTSMNVYWRRKGEETWRLLAAKRVKFPVQDDNAPSAPGQAEVREYRVIGVLGDQEVGQPSDIAEATWRP